MYDDQQLRAFRYRIEEDRVKRLAFKWIVGVTIAGMVIGLLLVFA